MAMRESERIIQQKRKLEKQELLVSLQGILETPMVILSFLMLILFIIEVSVRLSPSWTRIISLAEWIIWLAFILEFVVKLAIAPNKREFLEENWLMTLGVILPVFRIFRVFRAVKVLRSMGTLRVITVSNRTISKLGILLKKRGLQYVAALVVAVALLGGAGMHILEREAPGANIRTFGDALWWSAGTITTVGNEEYPVTPEGRILAVFVMVFGMSVFGYLAGSLASLFVQSDRDDTREEERGQGAEDEKAIAELSDEIRKLEERISALSQATKGPLKTGK